MGLGGEFLLRLPSKSAPAANKTLTASIFPNAAAMSKGRISYNKPSEAVSDVSGGAGGVDGRTVFDQPSHHVGLARRGGNVQQR